MAQIIKLNGQKLDLDANPDLLFHLLLGITNLEERLNSIDKRLYNLERKTPPPSAYLVTRKKETPI